MPSLYLPRRMRFQLILLGIVFFYCAGIGAQPPLEIENLIAPQHSIKFSVKLDYLQTRELVNVGPLALNSKNSLVQFNRFETASAISQVRWGLGSRVELNASYGHQTLDASMGIGEQGSDREFLLIGGAWEVSPENSTPALVLNFSLEAAGNSYSHEKYIYAKTQSVGATIYRSLDPVVLSASANYTNYESRPVGVVQVNPGDVASFHSNLNFAVNHRLSLLGGVGLRIYQPSTLNGMSLSSRETFLLTKLGVGLRLGRQSTLFANTEFTLAGEESASLMLEWIYQF
ncbi:hypothetical protein [Parahaliea mediterranea]|uniref:Uncharacterized protein n=1 Tax=Parahaliea mediterranea TaxID=651086 RepID=A0A939DCW8_9GAMM|nr:hypothetical protein [Parahaliea mediterranea]MBN7795920.1 hypothetical protein [Parahaliea mediterranea]